MPDKTKDQAHYFLQSPLRFALLFGTPGVKLADIKTPARVPDFSTMSRQRIRQEARRRAKEKRN